MDTPASDPTVRHRRVGALDGLRGFALVGMLSWHAELDWVRGGFARMTIFFVLSGYLATRSWDRRRDEGFRRFWVRRTLRLAPMTLVGVALAIAVTVAVGTVGTQRALGGDVISVLSYTSNWHFLDTGQSYGELFERRSAFQHYWSLSIEEQLFLVLPVLLAGGAVVAGWMRRPRWIVLAAAAAVVGIGSVAASLSPDAVYFGTQTRLVEFLVGAALATVVGGGAAASSSSPTDPHAGTHGAVRWTGRVSALVIVVTLIVVDRKASWLYDGGILLFALPVVATIAAIERRDPWLHRLLDVRPLVWLGRAALSIYVLHWPLFVLADDLAPSSTPVAVLAVVKVCIGVAVGGIAHRWIEQPLLEDTRRLLREGRPVFGLRLLPMASTAAVLAGAALVLTAAPGAYDFDEAESAFAAERPETDAADDEIRVEVYGGSTALMNGLGLIDWSASTRGIAVDDGDARLGCGLLQSGERPQAVDERGEPAWFAVPPTCGGWPVAWQRAAGEADVALVFFGVWEIADWRFDGPGGPVTSIEDPRFRRRLAAALDEGVDRLLAGGVDHVVLMTAPVIGGGVDDDRAADRALPADHATRTQRFNDLVRERAAAHTGAVSVFDYAGVIEGLGRRLPRLVPDGVHPTWDGAREIWSGPAGRRLLDHIAQTAR